MTDGKQQSITNELEINNIVDKMSQDLHEMFLQNNEYLRQLKDQHDEIQELRVQLIAAEQGFTSSPEGKKKTNNQYPKNRQNQKQQQKLLSNSSSPATSTSSAKIKRLEAQIYEFRNSYAFRVGQIVVLAIKKPGINTIMAPFRLIKLVFNSIFNRRKA